MKTVTNNNPKATNYITGQINTGEMFKLNVVNPYQIRLNEMKIIASEFPKMLSFSITFPTKTVRYDFTILNFGAAKKEMLRLGGSIWPE